MSSELISSDQIMVDTLIPEEMPFWQQQLLAVLDKAENPKDNADRNPYKIRGYKYIPISADSPFYPMAIKDGYILEHRLVIAQKLGRCLSSDELVHHINGIKDDNSDKNLELCSRKDHLAIEKSCRGCELKKRIQESEKEIRLLKWQMKILQSKGLALFDLAQG